ncbi:TcaA NTF2-like domain-containing protein [Shouchella patagoniensis]|uniref:TcaA NTF2-like domain-containing protein n=1 Tax=Shouchella patagoniensis TaxID=228576 RepID=UPI000994BD6E|nr:hypothetical protein [Shouchella patagoniensis]
MKYCGNCGKQFDSDQMFCGECGYSEKQAQVDGTARVQKETQPPQATEKRKRTKKEKIVIGIGVGAVVLLAGSYYAGSTYASAEKTIDRFVKAVESENVSNIENILTHWSGENVETFEAEAVIKLFNSDPSKLQMTASSLKSGGQHESFSVMQEGKFLGVFDQHKIKFIEQYVDIHIPYDGMTFSIYDEELEGEYEVGEYMTIGPIAPGAYEFSASLNNEYTDYTHKENVHLESQSAYYETIYFDMDIDYVTFSMYENLSNVAIMLNENEIPIEDGLLTVGPLFIDGSTSYQTVFNFPWGTSTSEEIPIESTYETLIVEADVDAIKEELAEVITAFGESYYDAYSKSDSALLKSTSSELLIDTIENSYHSNYGYYYAAQFDATNIWFDEHTIAMNDESDMSIVLPVEFEIQLNQSADGPEDGFYEEYEFCDMELVYEDEQGWTIYDCELSTYSWFATEGFDTYEGSQTVYASTGTDNSSEEGEGESTFIRDEELEEFIYEYNETAVEAINTADFAVISPFMTEDGPIKLMQQEYYQSLSDRGITQTHIDTQLQEVEEVSSDEWIVTTNEIFEIHYEDGDSSEKEFITKSTVKLIDNELRVHELNSTDEVI